MKNNVLSAFVIFFAVVACLLIIDDLTYNYQKESSEQSITKNSINQEQNNLATLDLQTKD